MKKLFVLSIIVCAICTPSLVKAQGSDPPATTKFSFIPATPPSTMLMQSAMVFVEEEGKLIPYPGVISSAHPNARHYSGMIYVRAWIAKESGQPLKLYDAWIPPSSLLSAQPKPSQCDKPRVTRNRTVNFNIRYEGPAVDTCRARSVVNNYTTTYNITVPRSRTASCRSSCSCSRRTGRVYSGYCACTGTNYCACHTR